MAPGEVWAGLPAFPFTGRRVSWLRSSGRPKFMVQQGEMDLSIAGKSIN